MPARVRLPDEAVDMTVNELHAWAVILLRDALITLFGGTALVLTEIFLSEHGIISGHGIISQHGIEPERT